MRRPARFPAGVRKCFRKGCPVVKRFRSGTRYCSRSCVCKGRLLNVDPREAHARAKKAGRAAGLAHTRRAAAKWANMTPADAYAAGYSSGYDKGSRRGFYLGYREARRKDRVA